MTQAEWLDWIAKGIVPVFTSCATVAALIVTVRNFGKTLRHQEKQLDHQREKDKREAVEDEKQRRREAYAEFFAAMHEQVQALVGTQAVHAERHQILLEIQAGQLPPQADDEVKRILAADLKNVNEKTRKLTVTFQMFLCVFPEKYISQYFNGLWDKLEEAARATLAGKVWTPAEWQSLTQLMHLWYKDQVEIIRRTSNE